MKLESEFVSETVPFSRRESILKARNIMLEDLSKHFVLRVLARKVGTNEFTLKKLFKSMFGLSVYTFLRSERMKKAEQLLKNDAMDQISVARACGFHSAAGFVTAFKKYHGITPGQHRQTVKKNL